MENPEQAARVESNTPDHYPVRRGWQSKFFNATSKCVLLMYLPQQYERYVAMDKTFTSPYEVSDTYRARVIVPDVRDTFMPPAEKSV
eukprot:1361678-Pleurochrysis_carterae.AAC.1